MRQFIISWAHHDHSNSAGALVRHFRLFSCSSTDDVAAQLMMLGGQYKCICWLLFAMHEQTSRRDPHFSIRTVLLHPLIILWSRYSYIWYLRLNSFRGFKAFNLSKPAQLLESQCVEGVNWEWIHLIWNSIAVGLHHGWEIRPLLLPPDHEKHNFWDHWRNCELSCGTSIWYPQSSSANTTCA